MNIQALLNNNKIFEKEKIHKAKVAVAHKKWQQTHQKQVRASNAKSTAKRKRSRLDTPFGNGSTMLSVPLNEVFGKDEE